MKVPPSALILPRDLGDHWGCGFSRLYFTWAGKKYELPPVDGYSTVRDGWLFTVIWKDRGWIAPGLFFDGGYIIHAVAVIEE